MPLSHHFVFNAVQLEGQGLPVWVGWGVWGVNARAQIMIKPYYKIVYMFIRHSPLLFSSFQGDITCIFLIK